MRRRLLGPVLGLVLLGLVVPRTAPATAAGVLEVLLHGPGPVVSARPEIGYTWTLADPSTPVSSYDVSWGIREHGSTTITALGEDSTTGQSWTLSLAASPDESCLRVRARDASDNPGDWTPWQCTYGDADPPQVGWVGPWTPIVPRLARVPLGVRYTATDDDRVSSYDVLARLARPGRPWSPWTAVPGWQRITTTTVRRTWPAGSNVCFLVRARDRVGHVGTTNLTYDSRCAAVPYDDRGLARSDGARRTRPSWALGRTATVLTGRAALTGPRTPMRAVWVAMRGRGGYCPRLWVGSHRIGAARCHWYPIAGRSWYVFTLPGTMAGRAVIRASRYDSVRVDAVAFQR